MHTHTLTRLLLAALLPLAAGCGIGELSSSAPGDTQRGSMGAASTEEVLFDRSFETGLQVMKPMSQFGASMQITHTLRPPSASGAPLWRLAQWSSQSTLTGAGSRQPDGSWAWATADKRVSFGSRGLSLAINAENEFKGVYRKQGGTWPHLLVEQDISVPGAPGAGTPTLAELSKLAFSIDAQLDYSHRIQESGYDPTLHAAQFFVYFTVQNLDASSPHYGGDFLWLQIMLYDDREAFPGKGPAEPDAAMQKFIYEVPLRELTSTSLHSGQEVRVQGDILAHAKKAVAIAKQRGLLASDDLSQYRIGSMNMGWEVPGRHIATMTVDNISLRFTKTAATGGGLRAAYRAHNPSTGDHMLTLSPAECSSHGYSCEGQRFSLFATQASDRRALYRCRAGGDHFTSNRSDCEGQVREGLLGWVARVSGTSANKALYRCFRQGDHLATTVRSECTSNGYTVEGVLGFVK